jgi:superfamily II DNA/RNA helicase
MDMNNENKNNENNENKENIKTIERWDDIEVLKEYILRGIYSYGYETPSPIQKQAIIPMINGNDIVAQAQSGTGKTGAFSVSTLQLINTDENKTQALIMAPTRELAMQISGVISALADHNKDIRIQLLVGGTSVDEDIYNLRHNTPHIIVGCPGRVHDMMKRNHVKNKDIKLIVLDEADEMLCVGFKEQVYNIFQFLSKDVQVGLFSATLPYEINSLTDKFMRDPVKILVKSEMLTLEGISQYFIALEDDDQKFSALKDLFNTISMSQCIIYCNSVKRVQDLYDAMINENYPVCCIHSGMEKEDRTNAYKEFKTGTSRVLISSNVTARGIDIQQVSTVINFDISKDVHTYLHRIGRSGRWGRKGVGINFITRRDVKLLKIIEKHYSTQIEELPGNFVSR